MVTIPPFMMESNESLISESISLNRMTCVSVYCTPVNERGTLRRTRILMPQ